MRFLSAESGSVESIEGAAREIQALLDAQTTGTTLSGATAGTQITAGTTDHLQVSVNGEAARVLTLGTQTSGAAIAAVLQTQLRAQTAASRTNASGYSAATATYDPDTGQYLLTSGTRGSAASSIVVTRIAAPSPTINDAAVPLKLGLANGGTETQGSSTPLAAMHLLRQVVLACQRLRAFPEYFAASLPEETAALQLQQVSPGQMPLMSGDYYLTWVLLLPGESLQHLAAKHGIAWETIALANHLQFPYIVDGPTTLQTNLVTSATTYTLDDTTQDWPVEQWQGQRVDIVRGDGAGQSRGILSSTGSRLLLETPWSVVPNTSSTYAIRVKTNPFIQTGTATAATAFSLTDATLAIIPECQRGYELRLIEGPGAGQRRRIAEHTAQLYMLDAPWKVLPTPATRYAIVQPQTAGRRTVLLPGDPVAIPQPASFAQRQAHVALVDMSTITGAVRSAESLLFHTDLLLEAGEVRIAPNQDFARVTGKANVRQAVLHLLNLGLGELSYAPGLGSYLQEHLGRTATLPLQLELVQSLERTIRADPRIARLGPVQMIAQGGTVELSFQASTITGDTIDRIAIR